MHLGINNTTLSIFLQPLYGFGLRQIGKLKHLIGDSLCFNMTYYFMPLICITNLTGFFYFTPIIAAILGEVCGHWLHDLVAKIYIRRHAGYLEPEARLWVLWISTPFMVAGLVLLGFSLEYAYHWSIAAIGWALYVWAIMISTVGVNAYVLDAYPGGSGEVSAWLNFSRTTGGLFVTYFQVSWANSVGPRTSFGTQAGICAGAFFLVLGLQMYGKSMVQRSLLTRGFVARGTHGEHDLVHYIPLTCCSD